MAGIYVHIPLCAAKCAYCDFYSVPRGRISPDALVDALTNEFSLRRHELGDESVSTIYIGGGTPSSLSSGLLTALMDRFREYSPDECTVEVNPEDITAGYVTSLVNAGINRVSMGVQSLVDSELSFIGRRHSARDAIDAVRIIKDNGIDNLSLDLIYGLPGQTVDTWRRSLDTLLGLYPQHISAYLLSYEPGTRLTAMLNAGKITETPDETIEIMYNTLCRMTSDAGFDHYEISNFSQPGRHSRHNSSYWDGTAYLGLGPGAHSFTLGTRRHNPSDIRQYIKLRGSGITVEEPENDSERFNDFIITSLRTADGLNLAKAAEFGRTDKVIEAARPHLRSGKMLLSGGRLRIAETSWLVADSIMRDFIEV